MNMVIRQQTKRKWNILLGITLLCALMPYLAKAQGVTGTTITLDGSNCTVLYSQGAQSSSQAYFSYLRHNSIPIQIINANYYGLADTGTGFYSAMVNNMGITDGKITLYNNAGNYDVLYIAIVAPKGYNIARYVMDVNSSEVRNATAGNAKGAVIQEFTYTANNSNGEPVATDNNFTLTGAQSEVFEATKSGGVNRLYFKVQFQDTKAYQVTFNQLKITFTIDESFEVTIPNDAGTTEVHTNLVDLGEFTYNEKKVWTFTDSNVNDLQAVGFFGEDSEGQDIETNTVHFDSDDFLTAFKNGTFYFEAPKAYRVTSASLMFLSRAVETEASTQYTSVKSLDSGHKYVIGNGSTFLGITMSNNSTYTVSSVTSRDNATVWTVTSDGNGKYYLYSEDYEKYLYADGSSLKLSDTTAAGNYGSTAAWTYDTSTGYLYMDYKGRRSTSTCYLRISGSSIGITTATTGNTRIKHPFEEYVYTSEASLPASTYTATVYGADGETVVATAALSPGNNEEPLYVGNLNNDAVKFSISGLEGDEVGIFKVSINVQMLDPYINVIKTAYKEDGNVLSEVSSASENMVFNGGETIVVPIPGEIAREKGSDYKYPIVFRDAFNENRTDDYNGTASGSGLSNYYLIKSEFYDTGSGNKVDTDQAGTKEMDFTNIKDVKAGLASRVQDNDFSESAAGFATLRLGNEESKTVYVYSADEPTHLVVPERRRTMRHISYAFYKATVMPYVVEEMPDIEVADIEDLIVYKETLKGSNNKNPSIAKDASTDKKHYFFGIKVKSKKEDPNNTSEIKGVLTSDQIVKAVKDVLVTNFMDHLYSTEDPYRTILYLDMSELNTVSDADGIWEDFFGKTADNCLYFMPAGSNLRADNVVAGGPNGEATGDIIIYDQQPFFTPYTFKTGTHEAYYERTGSNGKDLTQNTTLILPFDIPLTNNGYLKTYSNVVNEGMRFYQMTAVGETDPDAFVDTEAYLFTAKPVTTGIATANTPYQVVSEVTDENKSYVIQLTGTTFRPYDSSTNIIENKNGSLTGYGNYSGVEVDKSQDVLYFSKDYFWRSTNLTSSNTVKILPYRVYYKSANNLDMASKFSIAFIDNDIAGQVTTGLDAAKVKKGLTVSSCHGSILVAAAEDVPLHIFDLYGRLVVRDYLKAGAHRQYPLQGGVYIANGVKLLVK